MIDFPKWRWKPGAKRQYMEKENEILTNNIPPQEDDEQTLSTFFTPPDTDTAISLAIERYRDDSCNEQSNQALINFLVKQKGFSLKAAEAAIYSTPEAKGTRKRFWKRKSIF